MKYLLIVVVLAVVAFLAYRRIRGSGSALRDADPRTLRDEFRGGSHDDRAGD
ncbi:hypothetical protein [Kineococcus rhizosphaerae]|uniref:Uncharacterized protein n=1 Tax=Kineococcus rhizosphaerae TaxID=559628 RepID=A0A2T0R5R8_9ACTN|nr:hypothetical protein [Kineococcus rhizosphaerae]PRY16113.1 hypothetical protein CLV37_104333 [Kineococcus rhizosphaerae]